MYYCLTWGKKKRKKRKRNKKNHNNKLPADFKPIKQVLLVFLDAAGRGGLGFAFLPSYGFGRMGAMSRLQYSQLPSPQPRSSISCWVPTVHLCQACAFNPPRCVEVCAVCLHLALCKPTMARAHHWTSSTCQPQGMWRQSASGLAARVSCWASGWNQPLGERLDTAVGHVAAQEFLKKWLRAFFFFLSKSLLFKPTVLNKLSAFHTAQLHWRLSGSGSDMAQLFSLLQVSPSSPISLVMT